MANICRKGIVFVLLIVFFFSCKNQIQQEGVYELLIAYSMKFNNQCQIVSKSRQIILNSQETDSIRRVVYHDVPQYVTDEMLISEFDSSKYLLKRRRFDNVILKNDPNYLLYYGLYDIDFTKNANTVFVNNYWGTSVDSLSQVDFFANTVILLEPNYSIYVNDSIYIPHASRLMCKDEIDIQDGRHIFVYDRDRHMIVSSEFRNPNTHETFAKYSIVKVIKITQVDFYEFWDTNAYADSVFLPFIY